MNDAFEVIGARLLGNAADTLAAWLPKGRRQGREWCLGSLGGEPGQSLKINIDSGKWQDFSTGEKGGDLISLYAALHGLNQGDALQQLGGDDLNVPHRTNGAAPAIRQIAEDLHTPELIKPPADLPVQLSHFRHARYGSPAHTYLYRDTAGALLYVVARYESEEGKSFAPFTWDGARWRMKAAPRPRPLYGLERLEALTRRVVIVEGEKAADALQRLVTRSPIITWPGGANNWRYADWSVLAGRQVLVWPDADPPGVAAAQGIAGILLGLGCRVERVDVEGLADGYDAADLLAGESASSASLNEFLKPRLRPVEPPKEPAEPQRVEAPGPIEKAPRRAPPAQYSMANDYELAVDRRGIINSAGNVGRLVAGLIHSGAIPPMWWDEFLQRRMTDEGEWQDADEERLLMFINSDLNLHQLTKQHVQAATNVYARNHPRDCVADWVKRLHWDGESRLEDFMARAFGASPAALTGHDAAAYLAAVGRCFLMGIVARVLRPGCQLDYLPVFEGPQGAKKSKALRLIGGEWHAEVHEDIRNKDFYLSLAGKILVEISEFQSFKRGDIEMVKAVITRPTDRYRVPFARTAADHPRRCAFAASTNDYRWNMDPTGARRFWPIRCGVLDLEWIEVNREQLFAEATQRVLDGQSWWDVPEALATAEQRARYNLDAIELPLKRFLSGMKFVTLMTIMSEGLGLEKNQRYDTMLTSRVLALLTRWKWRESTFTDDSRQTWEGFSPPAEPVRDPRAP